MPTWLTGSICDVKDSSCVGVDNLIGPVILQSLSHRGVSRKEGPNLGMIVFFHRLKSNRWAVGVEITHPIAVLDVEYFLTDYFLTGYESDGQMVKQNSRIVLISVLHHTDGRDSTPVALSLLSLLDDEITCDDASSKTIMVIGL